MKSEPVPELVEGSILDYANPIFPSFHFLTLSFSHPLIFLMPHALCPMPLQIMSAVRQIKALVADRKVGNLIVSDR